MPEASPSASARRRRRRERRERRGRSYLSVRPPAVVKPSEGKERERERERESGARRRLTTELDNNCLNEAKSVAGKNSGCFYMSSPLVAVADI